MHRLLVTKYNGSQHSIPLYRVWSVSPLYSIPMMMTIIIYRYIKGVFVIPQQPLDQLHLHVCVCVWQCVLHLDDIEMRCNMHCTARNMQKNFTNEIVELIVSCRVIWRIRFDDNHANQDNFSYFSMLIFYGPLSAETDEQNNSDGKSLPWLFIKNDPKLCTSVSYYCVCTTKPKPIFCWHGIVCKLCTRTCCF